MVKLLSILGARPQFIKAAALSRAIASDFSTQVREVILHTGQHYDASMSDIFFSEMQIPLPNHYLGIGSESHGLQTAKMLEGIEAVLLKENPDAVVVYGDTNSTLAGALAAAKLHIPVIHIEAGLRSYNKDMPEEINRIACDHMSTLLFSPTLSGINNLRREGIEHHHEGLLNADHPGVYHCGDVMYDNTLHFLERARKESDIQERLGLQAGQYMLGTIHRPSNTDVEENLKGILDALSKLAEKHRLQLILPLHPRTRKILRLEEKKEQLPGLSPQLRFIPAVSFLDMLRLEDGARLMLTDSGGVQKEAWFMKKAVVVLREETEWVEIIEGGKGILTGANPELITAAVNELLERKPSGFPPIFGEGRAAQEILKVITTASWR